MKRILIVEDDELIAELERDYLELSGFRVDLAFDGEEGLELAVRGGYDTVILDVMLPGKNGFELCQEIRKKFEGPILMVTAQKDELDKIRALGLGADDYVVKPFSPAELVARVKSHLQMHDRILSERAKRREKEIRIGDLLIVPGSRHVYVDGREMRLANKEFELLLFLAENPNVVFSKDALFDRIWGMDPAGNTATVTVHINRLREKLEQSPKIMRLIETVWGAGYRFRPV